MYALSVNPAGRNALIYDSPAVPPFTVTAVAAEPSRRSAALPEARLPIVMYSGFDTNGMEVSISVSELIFNSLYTCTSESAK